MYKLLHIKYVLYSILYTEFLFEYVLLSRVGSLLIVNKSAQLTIVYHQ